MVSAGLSSFMGTTVRGLGAPLGLQELSSHLRYDQPIVNETL
jgi:hypothetical protein